MTRRTIQTAPRSAAVMPGGSAGLIVEYTLTAGTTNIASPSAPTSGQALTVFLTQDATGGRQITWAAAYKMAGVDIDTTPSTVSVFSFVGRSSGTNWWLAAAPATGITP